MVLKELKNIKNSMAKKNDSSKYYVAIIIALILGLAIVFYGYFNYRAKVDTVKMQEEMETLQLNQELENKARIEIKRNDCISDAQWKSSNLWDKYCDGLGREDDCKLPSSQAKTIRESREKDIANCIKMHPAN